MSTYYDYYIGYKQGDKIYPMGAFDNLGKIHPAISRSRSFASILHQRFYNLDKSLISSNLEECFTECDKYSYLYYLPLRDLGSDDFIKSGYFLIEDVEYYRKNHDPEDLFYEKISPEVYAAKLTMEVKGLSPKPQKDFEGNEFEVHPASDYMYFAYPDYFSEEYETFMIKQVADMFEYSFPKDCIPVVILSVG